MAKEPLVVVEISPGVYESKEVQQIKDGDVQVQVPIENNIPSETRLEGKAETLADKLLDDAQKIMDDPNEITYDKFGNEIIDTVSRRRYVASLVGIVAKMVQGKQAVKIKRGEEARNNASFLMDLLKQAQAGKLSKTDLQVLTIPQNVEQVNTGI